MTYPPEIENGVIADVRLEIEDHGILVFLIDIEFDGSNQGYLVTLGPENAYIAIRSVLEAIGEYKLDRLVGKAVRVKRKDGSIESIGHIYKDQWSKRTEEN